MTDDDGLDPLFDRVRPEAPPELAARIFAGLDDPGVVRRFRLEDMGDLSRQVLWPSAAAFLIALTIAGWLLAAEPGRSPPRVAAGEDGVGSLASLGASIEKQVGSHWLLAEGK